MQAAWWWKLVWRARVQKAGARAERVLHQARQAFVDGKLCEHRIKSVRSGRGGNGCTRAIVAACAFDPAFL